MTRQRDVLLDLDELRSRDHRKRILLAVDGALLERGEDFGERHRRRDDAELLVRLDVHRIFHRAHLESLEVVRKHDGALVVGHVPETVFAPGERDDALRREFREQLLADRAIKSCAGMRVVAEEEWDVENRDLGNEVGHRAG